MSVYCLRLPPRGPVDFAYMAGVSAHVLPPAPPTSDPGPPEGVQLHRGRGVHRRAGHTRNASHVPDPQGQQGTTLSAWPAELQWESAKLLLNL